MPNRILREGILTSERVNRLNWAEETFYRRLMSVVDDFGRYYAAPKLLRAACYPLHIDKVSDSDIGKWLSACETAALVRVYPAQDGKRYVEVLGFRQQVRAKESRFPQPPGDAQQALGACVADAQQVIADAHLGVDGDVGESARKRATRKCPDDFEVTDLMRAWLAKECPGVDADKETAKFRDHTFKTALGDWPGAWRNWMRRAAEYAGQQSKPAKASAWEGAL